MRVAQDLVEEILERLPVKSLLRFKSVSRTWKSTIVSQYFKERHMIRRQLREPDYLLIDGQDDDDFLYDEDELSIMILALGPPDLIDGQDHNHAEPEFGLRLSFDVVSRSCDGLVCIYEFRGSTLVANPSTKWMREIPQSSLQALLFERYYEYYEPYLLGFGKDTCTKTYKLVWLYNSSELYLEGATTCEVFDFNINTWRYVKSSPYRVLCDQTPIYVDGSLHWFFFKRDAEIKVISFDCHTEIFQEIPESPITKEDESRIIMCNLNNSLCVSEKKWPAQDIWALNGSDMTWEKMYSFDLSSCPAGLISNEMGPISSSPLAVLNKRKLLFYDVNNGSPNLVIYDMETRAYSLRFDASFTISAAPYFESLISIV